MSDGQTESSDGALKDIEHGSSCESGGGKQKADTGDGRNGDGHSGDGDKRDGDQTATGATRDIGAIGIQVSSRRTADEAGLNEGGEVVFRLEKVPRTG